MISCVAGFVEPGASIIIGAVAGLLCYKACSLKARLGYDDALDVVGVHGVGGTWGALATGIFAAAALTGGGGGLLVGNVSQFVTQVIAVLATYVFCGVGTFIILSIVRVTVGLRVEPEEEETGLDLTQHAENAYGG